MRWRMDLGLVAVVIACMALLGLGTSSRSSAAESPPCAPVQPAAREGISRFIPVQGTASRHVVATPANPAAGLYLFEDHVDLPNWRAIYHAGIGSAFIDGAAIMLNWKALEPAPGQFCWAALDYALADVLRLGKTFTLGLVAGGQTPVWLFDVAGVPGLRDVPFNPTLAKVDAHCTTLNQPLVWDPHYLHEYAATMTALAQHLRTIPRPGPAGGTAYDALVAIKLSGINVGTEELRLDAHPASPVCNEPDVAAMWRARGYQPKLVLQAWQAIAKVTAATYPGKLLNLDVILAAPFPNVASPIGPRPEHVGLIGHRQVDPLNEQILSYAIATYHRRLLVQWDALSQDHILPMEVTDSGKRGALTGYQMNGFGGGNFGGSGCVYSPGFQLRPCRSVADFGEALLDGIRSGALYIEVQPTDVAVQYLAPPLPGITTFDPALRAAQAALRQAVGGPPTARPGRGPGEPVGRPVPPS